MLALSMVFVMTPMAHAQEALPVEGIASHGVRFAGVEAERQDDAISVSGWVRRRNGAFGLVRAHLHVSSLDAEGRLLDVAEARWSGGMSTRVRSRHGARFSVELPASETARRVRVSIEADLPKGR